MRARLRPVFVVMVLDARNEPPARSLEVQVTTAERFSVDESKLMLIPP